MNDIKQHILSIPDFPKKGIIFKDITPLMLEADAFKKTIKEMAKEVAKFNPTKIAAPESRGFFFGPLVAYELNLPFMPIRKPNKLPRQTINANYALEYGENTLCAHREDIKQGDRIVIVDDVLATGGTAEAMCEIIREGGAEVAGLAFFMELLFLEGAKKLSNYNLFSLIRE